MEHYANAFTVDPGQCWRLGYGAHGHPKPCSEPVAWRGRWKTPSKSYTVDSATSTEEASGRQ
jgi:hypothetical protein